MRMMLFVSCFLLACQSNRQDNKVVYQKNDTTPPINTMLYPIEITNNNLESMYDLSKWYMYCIHSDVQLNFISKLDTEKITYGQLPLQFDTLRMYNDTVEIYFDFYYNGIKVTEALVGVGPYWGTVLTKKTDSIIKYTTKTTARYIWIECTNYDKCRYREVKPLQPEVIKYIKNNKAIIDPWFKAKAIEKGVIK